MARMLCQAMIGSYLGLVLVNIPVDRTINNVANKMDVGCANESETFKISYEGTGIFGWNAQWNES